MSFPSVPSAAHAPVIAGVSAPAPTFGASTTRIQPVIRGALYLLMLSIPFEVPRRPIPIEISTLIGFIVLLTTLLQPRACYRRIPGAALGFAAFLWVFGVSALVNGLEYEMLTLRLFVNLLLQLMLFWVLFNVLADARVLRGMLICLVAACILRAGMQIANIAVSAEDLWTGGQRLTVLGQNTNLSAMILSAGLVLLVGAQLYKPVFLPRLGLLTWPLAGLIGFAIVQGGSRGGILGAFLGLVVYAFRGRSVFQRIRAGVLVTAAIALLVVAVGQSEAMRGRLRWTAEGHLAGREVIYPALIGMFTERPVLGWGPYGNQSEVARRVRHRRYEVLDSHNLVLELLTSTGMVGAVPFLIGMFLCLRGAWRARAGPLGAIPAALMVAVLTGTVTGTWIAARIVWFALAFGAAAGAHWAMRVRARPRSPA
jgi:O-antigen ligase